MLVLNPSDGIYQIINGKLLGTVSNNEVIKLQANAWNNQLINGSQI